MNERNGYHYTFFTRDVQWAILASVFFPVTMWVMWLSHIIQFIIYRKSHTITLKSYTNKAVTKSDRRYKTGRKVVGHSKVSVYKEFAATKEELLLNKKKSYLFLVLGILNLTVIIFYLS